MNFNGAVYSDALGDGNIVEINNTAGDTSLTPGLLILMLQWLS